MRGFTLREDLFCFCLQFRTWLCLSLETDRVRESESVERRGGEEEEKREREEEEEETRLFDPPKHEHPTV